MAAASSRSGCVAGRQTRQPVQPLPAPQRPALLDVGTGGEAGRMAFLRQGEEGLRVLHQALAQHLLDAGPVSAHQQRL